MAEVNQWETRRMKLSELRPSAYNPRKIRDEAFTGLGNSIDKFGFLVPIVWNEQTGNIVGGHQRYRYLLERGEQETDVVVVDIDYEEEVALNISLNSPTIRGDFTKEVVEMLGGMEDSLGGVFNELGLDELQNYMKRLKFDNGDTPPENNPDGNKPPEDPSPNAVVTCPRCKSRWKMKDEEVIHNATEDGLGNKDGGD